MKRKSYLFIDRQVSDYGQLLAHAKPDTNVILLDGDRDGIAQINQVLERQQQVTEIHLVAHGSPDCLHLGKARLHLGNLTQYADLLQRWRGTIAHSADLLVYGCRVAAESTALLEALHRLTGANIAASTQDVGQGIWNLDRHIGRIQASLAFSPELQQSYGGTFGTGYALSNATLIPFDTSNPNNPAAAVPITGLGSGETLVGIDVRPQNGQLYGLAANGVGGVRLYVISPQTGAATSLTAAPVQFGDGVVDLPIQGSNFGIDFNPTVDRLRVVTDAGVNFRINPNTGAIVDSNPGTPGVQADGPINAGTTTVDATAYTNNFPNVTATTQYTLDAVSNGLYIQNPPNTGTQTTPLAVTLNGTALDFTAVNGFDIPPGVNVATSNASATGQAIALLTVAGTTGLYTIELSTGAAALVGTLGAGTVPVQGFANQNAGGSAVIGVDSNNTLLRFNTATPNTVVSQAIAGLAAGEKVVGIDFRPATGQLFALTTDGTGGVRIALLDPQTGAATPLTATFQQFSDAGGNLVPIQGNNFGIDFNPTVDRIRVVTDAGINFRINPNTGVLVDGDATTAGIQADGLINTGTTKVDATAYTNSFAGTTATTQYTLDATTDRLFIQNPPNNGTQTAGLSVTLNGIALDFSAVNGFDIPAAVRVATSNTPATGQGIAALTVAGNTGLYTIDLGTGTATLLGAVGTGTTSLTGLTVANAQLAVDQTLTGTGVTDTLLGGDGADTILGLGGADILLGGLGNDLLNGGKKGDTLTGGEGSDRFVYAGANEQVALASSLVRSPDRVVDFSFSDGDRFVLNLDSNLATAEQPRKLFNAGTKKGQTLTDAALAAYGDRNQVKPGNQALRASQAVFFTWRQKTYLSVNNSQGSFASNRDLLINVTGIEFKTGDAAAGVLSVNNYFG